MEDKQIKILTFLIIPIIIIFSLSFYSFAEPQHGYRISDYQVVVKVTENGELDITEKVKYSSLGNSNNAVILIDKQEDEEIEINNVYTLVRDEFIECERLSAGQWDANVFNGTYSVLQENNLVRVKVYGNFKKQRGTVVVNYSVKNSVKRYGDIALFSRNHILEQWNGYASDIDIEVQLPKYTDAARIKPFLHGVLVGQKRVLDGRIIKFNIPDTVPGEYIETRILFPENLVKDAEITSYEDYLDTVLEEEREYTESDKSHLLKVRENAAKEAGKKAWKEKMKQRAQLFSAFFSILASFSGLLTIYRAKKELMEGKEKSTFGLEDIPQLTPAEASMLLNGMTGARGLLGGFFGLASKGMIKPEFINGQNKNSLCFRIAENQNAELPDGPENDLLRLVMEYVDETGKFDIINYASKCQKSAEIAKFKEYYFEWDKNVKITYSKKNILTTGQLYYRNLGLILGMILFITGCLVSVIFSVLSAYLMLPVGFFVFWYSLNIQRKTLYSIERINALKELKGLIMNAGKKEKTLPGWVSDQITLIGFSIAIGLENKLHLFGNTFLDKDVDIIKTIIEKSLMVLNNSISAVLDH